MNVKIKQLYVRNIFYEGAYIPEMADILAGQTVTWDLINVALAENGATCFASTAIDGNSGCENAIDGILLPGPNNEWVSLNEGVGLWLEIIFDQMYK